MYYMKAVSPDRLKELLERVARGEASVDGALESLRDLPYRDIGVATIDHHRALRQGTPEVIFGESKSADQIAQIADELVRAGHGVLVTRVNDEKARVLTAHHAAARYAPLARVVRIESAPPRRRPASPVAVMSAGTSDIGVAEEAIETLDALGIEAARIYDVGVAGIHRLLGRAGELERASAAIVIAGMEGALPSVVGGIVACPVIAVPTSVGYGTALGGFTALMSMLTSCASGITVVNIDNGFGAAMAVHRILPRAEATP
jgi:pyridinium-3,5-biscarboxylic acid mononucleotide synthase